MVLEITPPCRRSLVGDFGTAQRVRLEVNILDRIEQRVRQGMNEPGERSYCRSVLLVRPRHRGMT
jgi:hypothetical protein